MCNQQSVKLTQDLIPGQIMNISSKFSLKDALNSLHTLLNANNLETDQRSELAVGRSGG